MTFASPRQFLWLIFWGILSIIVWRNRKNQIRLLAQLIELKIVEKIFPYERWKKERFKKNLSESAALLFLILSLAGPQIGQQLREIKARGTHLFILIDCSDSMLAEDFKPNRMEKSKRLLTGILEKVVGEKVGIIAFAGESYVYCPLTFDSSAVKQFLKSIEPGMIPQPGTRIGSAIRLALAKFPEGKSSKAIVLLTDGEDHRSDPTAAAEEAKKMGVRIFTIGIGNPEGEPIPIRDGSGTVSGYKKNKKGEVILSRLGESDLAQMALLTGGSYFRTSDAEQEIDILLEKISEMEKEPFLRKQELRGNRYQWFLLIALALLIFSDSFPIPLAKKEEKLSL